MKRAMVFFAIMVSTLLVSSPAIAGIGDGSITVPEGEGEVADEGPNDFQRHCVVACALVL